MYLLKTNDICRPKLILEIHDDVNISRLIIHIYLFTYLLTAVSSYHSNELLHQSKFYIRSRTSEQCFVPVYRVYSVGIGSILVCVCEVYYTI
jgi:hypothetical protein